MRDLLNNSTQKELIAAVNTGFWFDDGTGNSADGSINGTAIDLKGEGRKCLVIISVGSTSTATLSVSITSGTDGSTFGTTENEGNYDTTGITIIDLTPSNRYIRAEATVSATSLVANSCYVDFSVIALFYNERYRPSNVA